MTTRKTCGSEEARQSLPALLERANRGETTVITKRGRPYAALVPMGELRARGRGTSVLALRGSGAGLWGPSAGEAIRAAREEWD